MSRGGGKRASQRDFEQSWGGAGTCPEDGKTRYLDKGSAKRAIRRLPGKTARMHPYECGAFWHIGRVPKALVAGVLTRDELGPTRPREPYGFTPRNGEKGGRR